MIIVIIELILIKLTILFLAAGVPATILYNLFLKSTSKSKCKYKNKHKSFNELNRRERKELERRVELQIREEKRTLEEFKKNKEKYDRVEKEELEEIENDKIEAIQLLEVNRKNISLEIAALMKSNRLGRENILKIKDVIAAKDIRNITCKNFKNDLHCIYSFIKNRSTIIDLLMIKNILSKIDNKSA